MARCQRIKGNKGVQRRAGAIRSESLTYQRNAKSVRKMFFGAKTKQNGPTVSFGSTASSRMTFGEIRAENGNEGLGSVFVPAALV
jgi:hypothetical protein